MIGIAPFQHVILYTKRGAGRARGKTERPGKQPPLFELKENTDTFRQGHGPNFLVADALYLLALFGWTLFLPPLGGDWAALAENGGEWGMGCFAALFGGHAAPYHLLAWLLLYGCMVLVFFITRRVTRGPWWLGSVAAVLFLAHPLKAEAALSLSGPVTGLWPAFLFLAALAAYGRWREGGAVLDATAALAATVAAVVVSPVNAGLPLVLGLWEGTFVPREKRSAKHHALIVVLAAATLALHPPRWLGDADTLLNNLLALQFLAYPVGVLPGTARLLAENPAFTAVLTLSGLIALLLTARCSGHPAVKFGVAAACVTGLFALQRDVHPVHLHGGGQFAAAAALFAVAVAGVFHRLLHHPRWRLPVLWLSTFLCILLMALHAGVNLTWMRAGRHAREFRAQAVQCAAAAKGPVALCPDIRYLNSAPLFLAECLRHDTPFGPAVDARVLLTLDLDARAFRSLETKEYGPAQVRIAYEAVHAAPALTPHRLTQSAAPQPSATPLQLLFPRPVPLDAAQPVELRLRPLGNDFPAVRIPFPAK